jgi:hypothetical protein
VSIFRIGLVLVVAVVAAIVANVVLLNAATGPNDPVGKLSPRSGLVKLPASTTPGPSTTAPGTTTTPNDDRRPGGRGEDD